MDETNGLAMWNENNIHALTLGDIPARDRRTLQWAVHSQSILHTVRILEEPTVLLRYPDRLLMPDVKVSHKSVSETSNKKYFGNYYVYNSLPELIQQTSEHTSLAPGC